MLRNITAWVLSDGKAGDELQCLGVTDALGIEPEDPPRRPARALALADAARAGPERSELALRVDPGAEPLQHRRRRAAPAASRTPRRASDSPSSMFSATVRLGRVRSWWTKASPRRAGVEMLAVDDDLALVRLG